MNKKWIITYSILFIMLTALVYADVLLYDMEKENPFTNMWIEGTPGSGGLGTQTCSINTKVYHSGSSSIRWDYHLPEPIGDVCPTIEIPLPVDKQNWSGFTAIGFWFYLDLEGTKFNWTLEPGITHPWPDVTLLGNWNSDPTGVLPKKWIWHTWAIDPTLKGLNNVTFLRIRYHSSDGWALLARNKTITIYIDDITLIKSSPLSTKTTEPYVVGRKNNDAALNNQIKINADSSNQQKLTLTSGLLPDGKPIFMLNGERFFPIIYICAWHEATPEKVNQLLTDGFNMLNLGIDAPDAESKNQNLIATLERLKRQKTPVIIDLLHSTVMGELKDPDKESWNMQLANGERVKYFPDYANPSVRNEFLKRLGNTVDFLKPYYGNSVVAISIGVTDSLHIPDGEVHYAFKVEEPEGGSTSLPYGPYALEGYKKFIQKSGYSSQDIGFGTISEITLPTSPESAKNDLHWQLWILYRRYYIQNFVKSLSDMVKSKSQLPVIAYLDINFSRIEKYACPLFEFEDSLDFVGLYYYGLSDNSECRVPELMAYAYPYFKIHKKPLISFLELSSALGKVPTPSRDYILYSHPYVSGFCTSNFIFGGLDEKMLQWQYDGFIRTIREIQSRKKAFIPAPDVKIAILLSTKDPSALEKLGIPVTLADLKVHFDVVYDIDVRNDQNRSLLKQYQVVYTPPGQKLMFQDKAIQDALNNYEKSNGIWVKEGEEEILWSYLNNHSDILSPEDNLTINTAQQSFKMLKSIKDGTPKEHFTNLTFTEDFNGWDNALGSDTKVENNHQISVKKINKNMQGIKLEKLLSIPLIFGFTLTAYSGDPRLTLLSNNNREISIGQDKRGWIGIYINDAWIPFMQATLGKPYQYVVSITPSKDKEIVSIIISDEKGGQLQENWFVTKSSEKDYYMHLFWAYDDAEGTIKDVFINS